MLPLQAPLLLSILVLPHLFAGRFPQYHCFCVFVGYEMWDMRCEIRAYQKTKKGPGGMHLRPTRPTIIFRAPMPKKPHFYAFGWQKFIQSGHNRPKATKLQKSGLICLATFGHVWFTCFLATFCFFFWQCFFWLLLAASGCFLIAFVHCWALLGHSYADF